MLSLVLSATLATAPGGDLVFETARLVASDAHTGASFGTAVAIDCGTVAVGARLQDGAVPNQGAVYLFRREPEGWVEADKVTAPDGASYDRFGDAVALDGDTLVVGAPNDDWMLPPVEHGSVYVFVRVGGAWILQQKLVRPGAGGDGLEGRFGQTLALEGDLLAVGSTVEGALLGDHGAVTLYRRIAGTWTQEARFLPGAGTVGFGGALDLDGGVLVVGNKDDGQAGQNAGAVHVYEERQSGWVETYKLVGQDTDADDFLGFAVAKEGSTLLAGATFQDVGATKPGAVLVFTDESQGWVDAAQLEVEDGELFDWFGSAVALSGERAAVLALGVEPVPEGWGLAYVFERADGVWTEAARLLPSHFGYGDALANTVAIEGGVVVLANWHDDIAGPVAGAAYVFELGPGKGAQLCAWPSTVSVSGGGVQVLSICSSGLFAGDFAWIGGSASGSTPGFELGAHHVPLNPDTYFLFTVHHPGQAPLLGGLGKLDGYGKHLAAFVLPAGSDPILTGRTLHHAAGIFDGQSFKLLDVTPAAPVTLVP